MNLIPDHVALIMDGNRRWAKAKNMPVRQGHAAGVETLEKIVKAAAGAGIKHLTVYALSTENLEKRDKGELLSLFALITKNFVNKLPLLQRENIKISFLGNVEALPSPVKKAALEAEKKLQANTGMHLNIALNYSARDEILAAAKALSGKDFTQEDFAGSLTTKNIPDPDLIIRTGGQIRLSNFLLWQAAYSELYFTKKLWPDFTAKDLEKALTEFSQRKRNFGV